MQRKHRIIFLLVIFALVAGVTFWERLWVRGWVQPLEVAVYPLAVDEASREFIARLKAEDFHEIETFFVEESQRLGRKALPRPRLILQAPPRSLPPVMQVRSRLGAIQYSLALRWYAFRHTPFWENLGRVRLFVLYHQVQFDESLPHSLGLQKGLLGVVHVFASEEQQAQNNIVVAHELLHTLGATDKYDRAGQPVFPNGYAVPYIEPPLPQDKAEIMAGRIPITEDRSVMPSGLSQSVIGFMTAEEIGW